MRYGFFDDARREYVITRPDTPLPWINYLGNRDYFALISNTAGGYSFFKDARLRRITRYRYNSTPADVGGRYIYLREDKTGEFWSPTWQPTQNDLETYSCRHGLGYTVISSQYRQIQVQIQYFVPLGENLEIWDVSIVNLRENPARLSVFSAIEFCLWDAWDDQTNFQRNLNIGEVEVHDGVIYHKSEYRERRDHFAYFACSEPLLGFDTQREDFLGSYRGWDNPSVVASGKSRDSIAHGWSPIGSHHLCLTLEPGKSQRVSFILGYQENPREHKFDPPGSQNINKEAVRTVLARYAQGGQIDLAIEKLRAYWGRLLDVCHVQLPDEHANRMANVWNPYQCMVTFNLSRSASYYESGISRGLGFRDSNQDLLGCVHMVPERARERILDLASTQLANGGAYHQYQPLTKRGNHAVGSNFNDDPLWLVLATAAYLKETGDFTILEALAPYENRPGTEQKLYKHLQRSLEYTLHRLGPHGLPLIGRADWNDCLNLNTFSKDPDESFQTAASKDGRVAESIFIAGLFTLAAQEMAAIAGHYGLGEDQARYEQLAAQMEAATLAHGWDGGWFLRAYDDFGDKVGSVDCQEGQIYVEPQGICVMAGMGLEDGKARKALGAVLDKLATAHGIMLLQPAYSRYYLRLGEISSYPPGYKENGGVFCHNNPWIVIAETKLGNGDQAFDYYLRVNPSAREGISHIHRCEPYIYAQMIAGREAPSHGEAKNSWLTGTAAWNYVAITQWILGVRPTYQGLMVDPVIPKSWPGFEMERQFRGVSHLIKATRVGPGNAISLCVDGEPVGGKVVPLLARERVKVEVTIS
jgi:cellobiose phosphorylase